jgi:hypothetical protein
MTIQIGTVKVFCLKKMKFFLLKEKWFDFIQPPILKKKCPTNDLKSTCKVNDRYVRFVK